MTIKRKDIKQCSFFIKSLLEKSMGRHLDIQMKKLLTITFAAYYAVI